MQNIKNDISAIRGKSIIAMTTNETSVSEMMHMLGVKPETELVMEAIAEFGSTFDLSSLRDFLVSRNIMAKTPEGKATSIPTVSDIR